MTIRRSLRGRGLALRRSLELARSLLNLRTMQIGHFEVADAGRLAVLADELADALVRHGDAAAADDVLALAARHTPDSGLALRRAERALGRGDAAAALEALVPAWEAGAPEPRLEATLALTAIALGLYDIAHQLTEPANTGVDHAAARLLVAVALGEDARLLSLPTELVWTLKAQLRVLVACGRTDLVWALRERAPELGVPGLVRVVEGLPAEAPPPATPCRVALDERVRFRETWRWPAADAVFSWAWSVARDILGGERVLLLGPQPKPFEGLWAHGCVTAISGSPVEGTSAVARPEALPVAPGRFAHVAAVFWMRDAMDPVGALRAMTATLAHEGFLHLACVGPGAAGEHGLRLSLAATLRACAAAGLEVTGADTRGADGATGDVVHLVRAIRRIV